jgi:electron transfer flavoprotein beta subunit
MGMDRGVHVVFEGFADPVAVAEALVPVLQEEAPHPGPHRGTAGGLG